MRDTRDLDIEYRRPNSWRAPSWSWAAVEGPVDYAPMARLESLIEVIDAQVLPRTAHDDTGQIMSARLVLNGQMAKGVSMITEKNPRKGVFRDSLGGIRYQVYHDGVTYDFIPDAPDELSLSATYCCLLVGQVDWWGPKQCFFLVLKPSKSVPAAYERVGASCTGVKSAATDGPRREHFPIFLNAPRETICLV